VTVAVFLPIVSVPFAEPWWLASLIDASTV
jgi:hypothetical protein